MAIFLDDQPLTLSASDLGEALDAAQAQLAEQGRMIVEVKIDDQTLEAQEIEAQRSIPILAVDVHLYSAEPGALAKVALVQVKESLAEARTMQQEAAEHLQMDEQTTAMQGIAQAVAVWQNAQLAVSQIVDLMEIDLDNVQVQDEPVQATFESLATQLQELKTHIESKDTVSLADALAYEWPDTVARWESLMDTLLETI